MTINYPVIIIYFTIFYNIFSIKVYYIFNKYIKYIKYQVLIFISFNKLRSLSIVHQLRNSIVGIRDKFSVPNNCRGNCPFTERGDFDSVRWKPRRAIGNPRIRSARSPTAQVLISARLSRFYREENNLRPRRRCLAMILYRRRWSRARRSLC